MRQPIRHAETRRGAPRAQAPSATLASRQLNRIDLTMASNSGRTWARLDSLQTAVM